MTRVVGLSLDMGSMIWEDAAMFHSSESTQSCTQASCMIVTNSLLRERVNVGGKWKVLVQALCVCVFPL